MFWLLSFAVGGILFSTVPKVKSSGKRWSKVPFWARKKRPIDPETGKPIPPKPKPGKELEVRFGEACRKFCVPSSDQYAAPKNVKSAAYWNSNSTHPVCDARLTFFGISIVAECKECSEDRYGFRRISPKERNNLGANENAGGLSLVFILHRGETGIRLFGVSWLNWKKLEEHGATIKRTTFPLLDAGRPPGLRELNVKATEEGFQIDPDSLFAFLAQCVAHYLSWNLNKITSEVPNAA